MIPLENLKSVLEDREPVLSTESFLRLHRHLEGYFKRVLLISLRIRGVKYKPAVRVVESANISVMSQIEKAIYLLDVSAGSRKLSIRLAEAQFPQLFVLKRLFKEFSAPFRNQVSHGVIDNFTDFATMSALFRVDFGLYRAFEDMLRVKYGRSAFDQPKAWGARPGKQGDPEEITNRLGLGNPNPEPIETSLVEAALAGNQYATLEQINQGVSLSQERALDA